MTNVPLLNDYKCKFFWRRFSQTLLGGVKLRLGYDAPAYVYLSQLILFVIPALLGGTFSTLVQLASLDITIGCWVCGLTVGLFTISAQLTSYLLQRRSSRSVKPNGTNFLADDDEVVFDSCFGSETFHFVLPVKRWKVNILFHAVASAVMSGLGCLYLLPTTLFSLYGDSTPVAVVVFLLGWLAMCIAQYPLTTTAPPESAVYTAVDDSFEVVALMRPIHVGVFCAVDLVWRSYPDILLINQILHVVFITLPLLWVIGLLPPIDALFLWLGEQILVLVFGGSPVSTDFRLFMMLAASSCVVVVAYFIPDAVAVTVFSACTGYLLSLNLRGLFNNLIHWFKTRQCNRLMSLTGQSEATAQQWGWREVLVYVVTLLLIGGLSFACAYLKSKSTIAVYNPLGYGLIVTLCLLKVLEESQTVYVFFGLLRNKLYPESVQNLSKYKKRKRLLHRLAYLYRILLRAVAPLMALAYLSLFFTCGTISLLLAVGFVRAFRRIWQSTPQALLDLSVVHLINSLATVDPSSWWVAATLGTQLLITGALLDRFSQLLNKIYCFIVILIATKKTALCVACILLSPVFFVVMAIAAVLSAPLLPLFTLPILLIGFPRPLRLWPGPVGSSANTCSDTIYYKEMVPALCTALSRAIADGSLDSPTAGCHYLIRLQDRLAWIQILESGFGFVTLSIKGLELQETSCHTIEAGRLDDHFETSSSLVNPYPSDTLTPVDAVLITTYSDARNVLTGIIDSPDVLRNVDKCFLQTLIWVLLRYNSERHLTSAAAKSSTASADDGKPTSQANSIRTCNNWEFVDSGRPSSIHSRTRSIAKMLASSWDSIKTWEDDDSLDFNPNVKPNFTGRTRSPRSPIPEALERLTDEEEEEILKELNLGTQLHTLHSVEQPLPPDLSSSVKFTSVHSSKLSLPFKWRHLPIDLSQLAFLFIRFPTDWYCRALRCIHPGDDEVTKDIAADESLTSMYLHLTMACYATVNVFGLHGQDVVTAGASHVYKVYSGDIPWSPEVEWLKEDKELCALVVKAYRFAFKLAYDQAVLGEAESLDDIADYLMEYEANCYFGNDNHAEWAESIGDRVPQLFSLLHDPLEGVYKGRVLTHQPSIAYVGRLNTEMVRALWASLNLELLYFTNDDEERYSLQASPKLLRNLTVQAANPPLGYPIYASPPITISTY